MVAETIYMAWNSILCHPYSVDCPAGGYILRAAGHDDPERDDEVICAIGDLYE